MKITRRQLNHLIEQVVGYEPPHIEKDDIVSSGIVGDTVDSDSIESQEAKDSSVRQLTQKRQKELDAGETVDAETTGQQLRNLTQEVRSITRQQIRNIVNEVMISERGTGNPALQGKERAIVSAVVDFVDEYRLVMSLDPNDFGDDRRVRQAVQDIMSGILGEDM